MKKSMMIVMALISVSAMAQTPPFKTTQGGTGLNSYTQGDMLYYGSGPISLTKLAKDANATRYLSNQGTSNNPSWNQVNLANGVTGSLVTPSFTTGFTIGGTAASGTIPIGNGTNFVASTPTYPNTSGTDGQYLMSNGTNVVFSDILGGSKTSTGAGINTTETILAQTPAMNANRLQAGTVIRVTLTGTCTASVSNSQTWNIKIGTAGTTADGNMQQLTGFNSAATGTNIQFRIVMEITIRTTGAAATSLGTFAYFNNGATGLTTVAAANGMFAMTATNFNSTTASNIISVSFVSAATTTTHTYQQAFIELIYK